jgi:hypothetical protein
MFTEPRDVPVMIHFNYHPDSECPLPPPLPPSRPLPSCIPTPRPPPPPPPPPATSRSMPRAVWAGCHHFNYYPDCKYHHHPPPSDGGEPSCQYIAPLSVLHHPPLTPSPPPLHRAQAHALCDRPLRPQQLCRLRRAARRWMTSEWTIPGQRAASHSRRRASFTARCPRRVDEGNEDIYFVRRRIVLPATRCIQGLLPMGG